MNNKLKIEQQFVVDGKIFESQSEAEKYIEEIEKERPKNPEYNDTIYYENWTTDGMEGETSLMRARWQSYEEALDDMKNYANSWRQKGTGWIIQVTITTNWKHEVFVKTKRVYEKNY